MIHQPDLDNHANQLNPNNDAYYESRGEDGRPDDWQDGGSSHRDDDDDYDGGDDGPSTPERERPEPKRRTVRLRCANCRTESDMVAVTVDAGLGRSQELSKCPSCGVPVAIQGEWAMRILERSSTATLRATPTPAAQGPKPEGSTDESRDPSLQNAVISYLSQSGYEGTPLSVLYRELGVRSRSPSYSIDQFETFLDDMVSRSLILGDRVFRIQRYV